MKKQWSKKDLIYLLELSQEEDIKKLFQYANKIRIQYVGKEVYYRGLIEFSNICNKDCLYCGIRKSNTKVMRYQMEKEEILREALWAYQEQYGSITLQSGEQTNSNYVKFCEDIILEINKKTKHALGITISMGEQEKEIYQKWFNAGASRYLLRIETSNELLYQKIHPQNENHSFQTRLACLRYLKDIGYQVGSGVMIGIPGQTCEDLANDLLFFEREDIDMIGMGPYIEQKDTPLYQQIEKVGYPILRDKQWRFQMSLKMIAIARILLKDVNIAATTALQALDPLGREKALKAGANVLMPIITNEEQRQKYQLYDQKPCINETAAQCKECLQRRVLSIANEIGYGKKGDSTHFLKRIR
ncbi:biotin synthase [Breznakia pachnodae]|uniref:Biotin synthase n=2 Tax=Breznakia pachnodae TaxID=265178 RepID=A0ABU0E0N7_9FIRM|nr:biotin synthase [Breznakia pachnodae]